MDFDEDLSFEYEPSPPGEWVPPPVGDRPSPVDARPRLPPAQYAPMPPQPYDEGIFAQEQANVFAQPQYAMGSAMPQENAHMLGLSLVLVATGTLVGARYAGLPGAGAGALLGGAALNLFRAIRYWKTDCADPAACEDNKREARVSGFYALLGIAGGGYIAYKLYTKGEVFTSNESETEPEPDERPALTRKSNACRVRPVGP